MEQTKQFATVEEFANWVNSELLLTVGALCGQFGPTHPVTLKVAGVNATAARIVAESSMLKESTEGGYDLGALSAMVNPTASTSSELVDWGEELDD